MKQEDIPDNLDECSTISFEFYPYTDTKEILSMRDKLSNDSWRAWFELTYFNTIKMIFTHINGRESLNVGTIKEYAKIIQDIDLE